MGIKIVKTQLSNIAIDKELRNDEKFHYFYVDTDWNVFNVKTEELIPLKDILYEDTVNFIFDDTEEYYGIPTGKAYIDEDGDIISYQNITGDNHPNRLKYKINSNNILLSSLRLAKAPAMNFEDIDFNKYVFSNGFYVLNIKNNWERKFVLYLLRLPDIKNVLDNHIYRGIGISSYKLDDLLKIKIPNVSLNKQKDFITEIKPIEDEITTLKKTMLKEEEIIDKVFKNFFNFDYSKFEEFKKVKIYNTSFNLFGRDVDTRFSSKFHRPAGQYVIEELSKITNKRIKHFLSEPIITGQGISPTDYDDSGDYSYTSMADIKNWKLETDEMKGISDEYVKNNKTKKPKGSTESYPTTLEINDILMARSGEGTIGKVAIIKDEIDSIFCDFIMRIKLKNYNPLFAYYYFRTSYFQYLIEIYKKGLGNNTNIFPPVVQELPIPDISLIEQQKIVDIIELEINQQNLIKQQILNKRNDIENLLLTKIKETN